MTRQVRRRGFLQGALALGAFPFIGCAGRGGPGAKASGHLKFLFMTDHHVETDFIQSFGRDRGQPVYTCWKPGDHAALVETYRFINTDPFCRDCALALFGGDQVNTGYLSHAEDLRGEMKNYYRTLAALDLHARTRARTSPTCASRPCRSSPAAATCRRAARPSRSRAVRPTPA